MSQIIVLIPAKGAVLGPTVKNCVEIAKPEVHVFVEVLVAKRSSEAAFFHELFNMTLDLHLDGNGLLQRNLDAVDQMVSGQ